MDALAQEAALKKARLDTALQILDQRLDHTKQQLLCFRDGLQTFAQKYSSRIVKDSAFRHTFHTLCTELGIDPLCSSKNLFNRLFGLGRFYNEISIQVIDHCTRTKPFNGGYLRLDGLLACLNKNRSPPVTEFDVVQAIKSLRALQCGYQVVDIGATRVVKSCTTQIDVHEVAIIQYFFRKQAQSAEPYVFIRELKKELDIPLSHLNVALSNLLRVGVCALDDQVPKAERPHFYFPGFCGVDF